MKMQVTQETVALIAGLKRTITALEVELATLKEEFRVEDKLGIGSLNFHSYTGKRSINYLCKVCRTNRRITIKDTCWETPWNRNPTTGKIRTRAEIREQANTRLYVKCQHFTDKISCCDNCVGKLTKAEREKYHLFFENTEIEK